MPMFIAPELVPVQVGDDTIWILPKMDVGCQGAVMDELLTLSGGDLAQMDLHIGAYNVALMAHNIKRWEGPSFDGTACTTDNVRRLDPDQAIVEAVLAEIQRRNPPRGRRDPKGSTSATA